MIFKNVKRVAESKGVSIYRIEKDLGFSSGSIMKWAESVPSVDKVKQVADYLGVTIEELLKEGD